MVANNELTRKQGNAEAQIAKAVLPLVFCWNVLLCAVIIFCFAILF
jgi:hypothetical protein